MGPTPTRKTTTTERAPVKTPVTAAASRGHFALAMGCPTRTTRSPSRGTPLTTAPPPAATMHPIEARNDNFAC